MYVEYIEVTMVNFLLHSLGSLLIHFLFQEHHDVIENLERVVNQPEHCCLNHFLFAVSILQEENFHLCPQSRQNQKGCDGRCPFISNSYARPSFQECNFQHFPQLLLLACEIFSNEQWGYQKHFQCITVPLNVGSYRFAPLHLHFYLGRAASTIL